ncbi:hypothetical protein I4U23_018761 [Adineta vaga]|nr:hypothetical protein I4U23_018761 [Adineta vaga]
MTSLVNDHILAEKKFNMLSNTDLTITHSNSNTFSKSITNINSSLITLTPPENRSSLSKVYPNADADYCTFILPRQFFDLITINSSLHERKYRPVMIDCRSQIEFGVERINSSYNVNCRAKLLIRKLTSKRLEDIESNLSYALNHSDSVILYDQLTDIRSEEKLRSSPLNLVVQAAKRSNKKIFILQGGFDAIKSQYPHLIQSSEEISKDNYEDYVPSTPDTLDKENFIMTEILPHIFVGNILDSQNLDRLNQNGITHIINSTPDLPCKWEGKYEYIRVDALDLPSQNIRKYFDEVFQFIDTALRDKSNNVLVHCSAGISRSPTLVLAYMIKKYHLKLDEAFNKMRQLRRIVDPNVSFMIQLQDWENKCLVSSSSSSSTTTGESIENLSCTNSRPTSSTYCGSTSKTKTDTTARTDSAISVQ